MISDPKTECSFREYTDWFQCLIIFVDVSIFFGQVRNFLTEEIHDFKVILYDLGT